MPRFRPSLPDIATLSLLGAVAVALAGCAPDGGEQRSMGDRERVLSEVDSIMSELGGRPTASLDRGQRWRMVSSTGTGLPPASFKVTGLPEPEARGAVLLQAYCVQCHSIPAPQMHATDEWPILMRRMMMRARTLHDRMGGPTTRDLLGEVLLSGMASVQIPSPEDVDSLTVYLQRHAMPVARPDELGDGPEATLFRERCGVCHEIPSPAAHSPEEWPRVVARMRSNMALMNVKPALPDAEATRIVDFLALHSSAR